ncbi:MAG: hypothetical protein ACKVT0_21330 [Planctomycetaceae bacterium]
MFALWANLHGSFLVGLACLGASSFGRALDVLRRSKSIRAIWHGSSFKRELLLLELAATAVLINPYGLGLYREVLSFSDASNLSDLIEWQPLTLQMKQGKIFVAVVIGLMMILRYSPRRISAREWLWLVGLGCATLSSSRLIVWWAPWAAWFFVIHGHAAWRSRRIETSPVAPRMTSGKWTVATLGLIWIAFAYAPLGGAVLHGRLPELKKSVTRQTPLGAVEYLHAHPPRGLIFNTYEWGDYLLWAGPQDLQVFVASHAHLIPTEVWGAYIQIIELGSGWDEQLDRFGFNTIVVDKQNRGSLIAALTNSTKWTLKLDDGVSVIFERKDPI